MNKVLCMLVAMLVIVPCTWAQNKPSESAKPVIKIPLKSMSPYLLYLILSGKVTINTPPEPKPSDNAGK